MPHDSIFWVSLIKNKFWILVVFFSHFIIGIAKFESFESFGHYPLKTPQIYREKSTKVHKFATTRVLLDYDSILFPVMGLSAEAIFFQRMSRRRVWRAVRHPMLTLLFHSVPLQSVQCCQLSRLKPFSANRLKIQFSQLKISCGLAGLAVGGNFVTL